MQLSVIKRILFYCAFLLGFVSANSGAVSKRCATSLLHQKLTRDQYGEIISLPPMNSMGRDFRNAYGDFLATHQADQTNFFSLAVQLFEIRLSLAVSHKTKFASQFEEGGWQERIYGRSSDSSWSYGMASHPQRRIVYEVLHRADIEKYGVQFENLDLATLSKDLGSGTRIAKVIKFPYRVSRMEIGFRIYQLDGETYLIKHADNNQVPHIMNHLQSLWKKIFDRNLDLKMKLSLLAEWEWLWFWTNPFGRAGASIGDSLSILLQEKLNGEGHAIRLRQTFINQDLEALTRNLEDYQSWRIEQIMNQ